MGNFRNLFLHYPALAMASIYVFLRLFFYFLGWGENEYKYLVSINILFIIIVISLALFKQYEPGAKTHFPRELKVAMRSVSIYALLLTVFVFIFFTWIDTQYFQSKLDFYRENLEATNYSNLPDTENPLKVLDLSKEDFIEREMEKVGRMNTPFAWSTLTLVGIMVVGLIYSVVLVFIRMKFLPRLFRK
jgi:magnesium-transporting ATPase (P-type)